MKKNLLVVAGEISGDMHAARIVEQLRVRHPGLDCWGIGGEHLRAAGMRTLYDVKDMAVLGLWEVLKRYTFFHRVFHDLVREMERRNPAAVVLVDYPGFNLRFARAARRHGCKVLYYICPQVWAWHRSRIGRMVRLVDRLMVIFPFEVEVFRDTSLRVDFVGHPLVDRARAVWAEPLTILPWESEGPRVALLPGSRKQEVERILPPMLDAACRVAARHPKASFLIAAPSEEVADFARAVCGEVTECPGRCRVVVGTTRQILRQARAAMVASGTATIETALMGCPMIVVYKTAPLTYWFGKQLIRVPYLGMVNLVAGRLVCPEYLQHEADPARMAEALEPLLDETKERAEMIHSLAAVAAELGAEDPVARAAAIIRDEAGLSSSV